MFLSVGDHQDVPLHGGDADLGGLRFQESMIVKADCIGQELILIRREQIFTAIKSPDKGSAGDLLLQLVEVFGLGDSVCCDAGIENDGQVGVEIEPADADDSGQNQNNQDYREWLHV